MRIDMNIHTSHLQSIFYHVEIVVVCQELIHVYVKLLFLLYKEI